MTAAYIDYYGSLIAIGTGGAGPTGPQGVAGATGSIGPQGVTGAIGPTGLAGATGPQGIQGPTGPAGGGGSVSGLSVTGTALIITDNPIQNSFDLKTLVTQDIKNVLVSNATGTVLFAWPIAQDTTTVTDVTITGSQSTGAHVINSASFKRSLTFKNNNGSVFAVPSGTLAVDNGTFKDVSNWDCTITNPSAGVTGAILVTAPTGTVQFSAFIQRIRGNL